MPTKGEQTRTKILDAAKELFLTHGYSGTSMRDIAEKAEIRAVGGIYNHFEKKELIFKALIHERNPYETIVDAIESGTGSTAPEYIASVLRSVMPLMYQYADFIDLTLIDAREFQGAMISEFVVSTILPRVLILAEHLQTLPGLKSIEPLAMLRLMASTVISYVLTQRAMPEIVRNFMPSDDWIDLYINTLLHGLAE
jgi:AcrR family transcriptional regulator